MDNWKAHTKHTLPFNCNNTIQEKTKLRKMPVDEGQGRRARRQLLMIVKT